MVYYIISWLRDKMFVAAQSLLLHFCSAWSKLNTKIGFNTHHHHNTPFRHQSEADLFYSYFDSFIFSHVQRRGVEKFSFKLMRGRVMGFGGPRDMGRGA